MPKGSIVAARIFRLVTAIGTFGVLTACGADPSIQNKNSEVIPVTATNSCAPSGFAGAFDGEVTLCQNWAATDQNKFWFLAQGSQIIPYRWFLALEQADNETPFRDSVHMDALRYLPQRPTPANPDGLPIGFTRDSAKGNGEYANISPQWLGLTCAACHTGQVEFAGRKVLVDGAPSMADFEGLMHDLVESLQATLTDNAKFSRFAVRLRELAENAGEPEVSNATLHSQLATVAGIRQAWNDRNSGDHPYGFARLDAIGAIFNEVTVSAMRNPGNRRSANAPVSYPFIWDTPQHDRVQWNGSVENAGPGALGRNVGEVLGVFGSINLDVTPLPIPIRGHESSVNVEQLGQLEALLWRLESPQWPESILPPINRSAVVQAKGKDIYERFCVKCHLNIDRTSPVRRIVAQMKGLSEIGTDPLMARNFADNRYASGELEGKFTKYLPLPDPNFPRRFGAEDEGVQFLSYAVIGTIFRELRKDPKGTITAINAGRPAPAELAVASTTVQHQPEEAAKQLQLQKAVSTKLPEPAYKARPLNGIWATAPYLHNGSVRTVRQLLLPTGSREASFQVGSREYDPKNIGYVNAGGFQFDSSLPGNSMAGHDGELYGNAYLAANPDDLDALLEYLKTL